MANPSEGPLKQQSIKLKGSNGLGNGVFTIQGFQGTLQTLYQRTISAYYALSSTAIYSSCTKHFQVARVRIVCTRRALS